MRDFDGNVHSIPFGEVQTIKNMSKDFAYAVCGCAHRLSREYRRRAGADGRGGGRHGGPRAVGRDHRRAVRVVGVEGWSSPMSGCRGRFKTRPLGQWNVKREFYRRIKAAFEARGIEIPYPHHTSISGRTGRAWPRRCAC